MKATLILTTFLALTINGITTATVRANQKNPQTIADEDETKILNLFVQEHVRKFKEISKSKEGRNTCLVANNIKFNVEESIHKMSESSRKKLTDDEKQRLATIDAKCKSRGSTSCDYTTCLFGDQSEEDLIVVVKLFVLEAREEKHRETESNLNI